MSAPTHVAIIPDGNRRWARARGLSIAQGHQAGAQRFREVALQAADRGVKYLSIWGLSLENAGKRSPAEIAGLMKIFREHFRSLAASEDIHSRQTKITALGRWRTVFPRLVATEIEKAMEATKDYKNFFLNFLLAYNGTDEMVQAVQSIVEETRTPSSRQERDHPPLPAFAKASAGRRKGEKSFEVTSAVIKNHLFTKDLPPVDLVIRTGGEPHLSAGFMMWDVADAQLYFPDVYWPDFTPAEFDKALEFYNSRERRFGK